MASKNLTLDINVDTDGIKEYIESEISKLKDSCLTRDQAIKRIRDIRKGIEVDHIVNDNIGFGHLLNSCERGAVNELMAIFDIKREEL